MEIKIKGLKISEHKAGELISHIPYWDMIKKAAGTVDIRNEIMLSWKQYGHVEKSKIEELKESIKILEDETRCASDLVDLLDLKTELIKSLEEVINGI